MKTRWFVFLTIVGLGWSTAAQAACPNDGASCAGIVPIFVQGDPDCATAAQICRIAQGPQLPIVFSPPPGPPGGEDGVTVTVSGSSATVKDLYDDDPSVNGLQPNQQKGRPGIEAIIVRRNGANIYCGTEILNDVVKEPGNQAPTQVTVCFAKGPCQLDSTRLTNSCGSAGYGGTAHFLQAYQVGPIEQNLNLCGCGDYAARFCDARAPIFAGPGNKNPRFVSCNPDGMQTLKSVEVEGTATMGQNSCVMRTIGGRRILVDSKTGTLC